MAVAASCGSATLSHPLQQRWLGAAALRGGQLADACRVAAPGAVGVAAGRAAAGTQEGTGADGQPQDDSVHGSATSTAAAQSQGHEQFELVKSQVLSMTPIE